MNYGLMYKLSHKLNHYYLSSEVTFALDEHNEMVPNSEFTYSSLDEGSKSKTTDSI